MSFTATGFVLLAGSVVLFLRDWRWLLYMAIFFAAFSATSVVNIDSLTFGITPYIYFSVVYCAAGLLLGGHRAFLPAAPFRDTVLVALAAFALVVLLATLVAGLDGRAGLAHVTQTGYLMLGLLMTGVVAYSMANAEVRRKAFLALRYGGMFAAAWGLFQLICGYTGIPYPDAVFNNSVSDFADLYNQRLAGGVNRISSVAAEPSFLAFSLVHVFAFCSTRMFLGSSAVKRTEALTVMLTGACLVLSTSTTAYVGLLVCGAMMLLARPVKTVIIGSALGLAGLLLLLYFNQFATVLDEVTLSKFDTWSFKDRFAATLRGWEMFLERPILGSGWGSPQDNLVVLLLTNVGLVGLACFGVAVMWTMAGTAQALARGARGDEDLWLDCAGCQTALYASLAMNIASGFKYVVFDFWFVWGATIATVVALQWSRQTSAAIPRGIPPHRIWQPESPARAP